MGILHVAVREADEVAMRDVVVRPVVDLDLEVDEVEVVM